MGETGSEVSGGIVEVGLAWTPLEFVAQALRAPHPFTQQHCEDGILRSVFQTLTRSPEATQAARDQALERWRRRARELERKEAQLKESVHPDVAGSVAGKRLLLFGEMLSEIGFPDPGNLIHKMATGFPLVGEIEPSGVFPKCVRPATSTIQDLWKTARANQELASRSLGPSADSELDFEVTKSTAKE
eukprot:13041880-Heterocapsa_arctica.AAC.1